MQKKVGGQALIEGVMMRCENRKAIAVRKSDGTIVLKEETTNKKYANIAKIPFLRGVYTLVDSFVSGSKDITYSASFVEDEEEEPGKVGAFLERTLGTKGVEALFTAVSFVLAAVIGVGLFVVLPAWIARETTLPESYFQFAFKEGIVKLLLLLLYMYLMSRIPDMRRVFQYHGAEHKSVFCYEKGLDLTVENVRNMSRFHPRCGTNFLFLVIAVSIFLLSFVHVDQLLLRSLIKIALLPVVSGIAYELIRLAGRSEHGIANLLVQPGLWLQKITTQEPDDQQIEVAIVAIKAALDQEMDRSEIEINESEEIQPLAG